MWNKAGISLNFLCVLFISSYFLHSVQCKPLSTIAFEVEFCNCSDPSGDNFAPPPPSPPSPPPPPPPPPPPATRKPTTRKPTTRKPTTNPTTKPTTKKPTTRKPTVKPEPTTKPTTRRTTTRKPTTKATTKPTTKATKKPTKKPTPPPSPAMVPPVVEMVFVVDQASRQVLSNLTNVMKMLDDFKTYFHPSSKFGLISFSDFAGHRWPKISEPRSGTAPIHENPTAHHQVEEACYIFQQKLTTDVESIKKKAKSLKFLSSGGRESSGVAMILGSVDPRMGWTRGKPQSPLKKVYVVVTDSSPHDSSNGPSDDAGHEIVGDGTDKCANIKVPPRAMIGEYLNKNGIILYGITQNDAQYTVNFVKEWQTLTKQLGIPYAYSNPEVTRIEDIPQQIKNFIGKVEKQ